jgi:hypothetical protein
MLHGRIVQTCEIIVNPTAAYLLVRIFLESKRSRFANGIVMHGETGICARQLNATAGQFASRLVRPDSRALGLMSDDRGCGHLLENIPDGGTSAVLFVAGTLLNSAWSAAT